MATIFSVGTPTTSWPRIAISPARGRMSPMIVLSRVVLPAPFAPTIATTSPGFTCSETRRSTVSWP